MSMTQVREIPFARPSITDEDRQVVMDVLKGHILTHGPQCKAFEAEFSAFVGDGAHALTVSSCMAALHLAYLHLGIGPGDEVIVPAQTHTATVHAVEWVGATPVFVDCDPATGNMTAKGIEAVLTTKSKALSVVHFVGIPCNMDAIMKIAERHRLKVVEDCAIALGARLNGTHVGMFGDAGCFSFYPVKHITTGEGGMFITKRKEVHEGVSKLRAFGVDRTHTERAIPGFYDVPTLGLNYRMSEMQAALGRSQLKRFPASLVSRKAHFEQIKSALAGISDIRILDTQRPEAVNTHYCLSLVFLGGLAPHRNQIVARLNEAGVGTSIYYPQPVPRMTYYRKKYGYEASRFSQASALSDQSVALPVGPHLTREDLDYVATTLRRVIEEVRAS